MAVISVRDLSVRIGRRRILDRITLEDITPGSFVGLIGPNASGKSTFLRTLAIGRAHDGDVLLDGADVRALPARTRTSRISLMPQTPPQGSSLSPYELMHSYARAMQLDLAASALEQRMSVLLDALGLSAEAHRPLQELSGGKRQLVGLCLAMIREPSLLLLDEPTSALDLRWQLAAIRLAKEYVTASGACAIVAVHDINLALRFCDRLIVLRDGQLAASGVPGEVVTPDLIADVFNVSARLEHCSAGFPMLVSDAQMEAGPDTRIDSRETAWRPEARKSA